MKTSLKKKRQQAKTARVKPNVFVTTDHSETEEEGDQENELLSRTMARLGKELKKQQQNFSKLHETFDFMSEQYDKLQKRIEGLVKINKQMKDDIKQLKQNEKQLMIRVSKLEAASAQIKQNNNENHMIVTNLPKFSEDTNLKQLVVKIGEQVNCHVDTNDIIAVYQNENKQYQTFPLIVKMASNKLKNNCIQFRKDKKQIELSEIAANLENGEKNINFHHLMEKEHAELLKKAKEAAKIASFKFVWFSKDCVLTRKEENSQIIRISNENDLKKIKA